MFCLFSIGNQPIVYVELLKQYGFIKILIFVLFAESARNIQSNKRDEKGLFLLLNMTLDMTESLLQCQYKV